ncbi:MAG: EFR1 family ferrodoxin [Paramuribaculum sp.]|nr:EFR1 family ferrodoxin [Paramuribaculum sp.]
MIFYHTGTGNSAIIAKRIAHITGDTLQRIDICAPSSYSLRLEERVVWIFPVYSWGIPPVVKRFIRQVSLEHGGGSGGLHFMVCSCGDDVGLTASMWRKEMRRRGWKACGAWSVQMPNNYVSLPGFDVDSPDLAGKKLEAAGSRLSEVVRGIECGARVDDVERGAFAWIKSRLVYPLFMRFLMSPSPFRHNRSCVGCGRCAAVCPRRNITIHCRRPRWGSDCAMCLACYHVCPHHAVDYGKRTRTKGQYWAPKQLPDPQP